MSFSLRGSTAMIISILLSLVHYSSSFSHTANQLSTAASEVPVISSRPSWVDCHPKNRPFQLLSWNLLAPCYAPPHRHPWSFPEHLEWSYRRNRIVECLTEGGTLPDILCLQEVQVDLWESDLFPALEAAAAAQQSPPSSSYLDQLQQQPSYYTGLLQKVKKKPIANAILVRHDFAKTLKQESRSRALIVVLELQTGSRLIVANVHLQAGEQEYHQMQRFYQLKSLLKRIDKFANQYSTTETTPSVVLVGDFNMTPDNPLYHLLRTGHLPHSSADAKYPISPELIELAQDMPQLPLTDAYRECPPLQGTQKSTYCSGDVIDYLWTSNASTIQQTWQSHPDASLDAAGMFLKGQRYPNVETPSDHLPIGGILQL